MSRSVLPVAILLALPASALLAQTERQHDVHVHGLSQVQLALDGNALELELHAPGVDIVGFEHAPGDDESRGAIESALGILHDPVRWLAFEPADACTITESQAHTHGYDAPDGQDEHEHDDHHRHAHEAHADHGADDHAHHESGGGHGEFHAHVRGRCDRQPRAVHLRLGQHFPGIQALRVDLLTDERQDRVELAPGQTRVGL